MNVVSDSEYLLIETKLIEYKQLIENVLKEYRVIQIIRTKSRNKFYFANTSGIALRIMYSSRFRCLSIVDVKIDTRFEDTDDILRIYFKELKIEHYWRDDLETYYNVFCRILEKILNLPIEWKPREGDY